MQFHPCSPISDRQRVNIKRLLACGLGDEIELAGVERFRQAAAIENGLTESWGQARLNWIE